MNEGTIIRSTGSWYDILDTSNKEVLKGRLKGKFRIKNLKVTNPLAVGDQVHFQIEDNEQNTAVIHKILPRKNYIVRQSIHKHAHGQLLATNIDQCLLMVTIKSPETSLGFIDRFLCAAESFRIPVSIIFNKMDLHGEVEKEKVKEMKEIYEPLGYPCYSISVEENIGLDKFQEIITGKINLLAGHSGVGKSSLLNSLNPTINRAVNELSIQHEKGTHTTTFAEMIEVIPDGWIIDSPGIGELHPYELDKQVLSHYFPEMREHLGKCKYNDCLHVREPQCAVKEAYEEGKIAPSRYYHYMGLLKGDDFKAN